MPCHRDSRENGTEFFFKEVAVEEYIYTCVAEGCFFFFRGGGYKSSMIIKYIVLVSLGVQMFVSTLLSE